MGCQKVPGVVEKELVIPLSGTPHASQCCRLLNLTVLISEQQALILFPAGTLET